MKKKLLIFCFIFGAIQLSQAQLDFGIKAGINYNSDSFQDVKEDLYEGAESKTGFHAGVWTRVNFPIIGMYIRPELVYTALKSEINPKPANENQGIASYDFQKIDIPVLIGKRFLKVVHAFVGPSFQYIIGSDFSIKDITEELKTDANGFTVGVQLGAGIEIKNIGLDVRWERAFSDVESKYISKGIDREFDTRVNQIVIGLSYKF